MIIGTLNIWAFVVPGWIEPIDEVDKIMAPLLDSSCYQFNFNYNLVAGIRANLTWDCLLESYFNMDRLYKTLRSHIDKEFNYWQLSFTIDTKIFGG